MPQTRAQARKRARENDTSLFTTTKRVRQLLDDVPSPFAYQQLDLRSHRIRILYLLPGTDNDPLRCVLRTAFLDHDPKYEALSYAWGDPLDCRSIEIDGRQKSITVNLYHALGRLRYPRRKRCLWVDALCIDQNNDTEKSHQVNLMSKIYSRTKRAILWLGDFSDEGNTTSNQIPRQTAIAAFNLLKFVAANQHYGGSSEDEKKELVDEGLVGLFSLLQMPWWHRAWTVQEAVLPADAIVVCGTIQMPFSQVLQAYYHSYHHHVKGCCSRQGVFFMFWSKLHGLSFIQKSVRDSSSPIESALNIFRARHASDPRDRVYAYLGLGSEISANYALPHEEVFKLTTRSLIEKSGTLESLLRTAEEKRSPTLPTWVPDWSADFNNKKYDHELGWFYLYSAYQAAGKTKVKTRNSSSDTVLDLQGLVLDRIVGVGHNLDTKSSMKAMVAEWKAKPKSDYPRGGTYHDASWSTLLGDIDLDKDSYDRLDAGDDPEAIAIYKLDHGRRTRLGAFDRRGFSTETGLIGIGNRDIQIGDSICVLAGGNMPFILRQVEGHTGDVAYQYIGQSYVHGIMDGETMNEGRDLEWISLV